MSTCTSQRDRVMAYLAGDISLSDLETLLSHATDCEACRGILELHRDLTGAGSTIPEPSEREFEALRHRVMERTATVTGTVDSGSGSTRSRQPGGLLSRLTAGWGSLPWLRPGLVAALLVVAVLGGRWSVKDRAPETSGLLDELQQSAALQTGLDSFWDAPVTYANVTVRPREDGMLELGFDACRHVELTTPRDAPLAREVLVHAILDRQTLGSRLQALRLVPEMGDDRLRDALVFTLHHDPEPAVRLQALTALNQDPDDARVQEALLVTLRDDPSVQLRLMALDGLVSRRVDVESVRHAIRAVDQAGDEAVMLRATRLMDL